MKIMMMMIIIAYDDDGHLIHENHDDDDDHWYIADGRWSPANIPTCVRENHPAIKWAKTKLFIIQTFLNIFQ